MAEHYGKRPSELVGMEDKDVMERLRFDHLCFSAGLAARKAAK